MKKGLIIGIGILVIGALFVIQDFGSKLAPDSVQQPSSSPVIDSVEKQPEPPAIKAAEPEPQVTKAGEPEPEPLEIKEPEQSQTTSSEEIESDCSGDARSFTGTVTEVIDGDTIRVDGQSIRFALSSAPELYESKGDNARELVDTICPVGSHVLVDEDDGQTQGSYGRIIAVIYCNDYTLNKELLDSGLGEISFEFCDQSEFGSSSWALKHGCFEDVIPEKSETSDDTQNCDSSYPDFCIPSPPPDLDCGDIPQKRFTVLPPDPHRFDGDNDGIGCES